MAIERFMVAVVAKYACEKLVVQGCWLKLLQVANLICDYSVIGVGCGGCNGCKVGIS